jgi:hypothetical protein
VSYDPNALLMLSPSELEGRRREIIVEMSKLPRTYQDAPTEMLQELAFITGTLRRKTAGPPKEAKRTKRSSAPAASIDDLDSMLS